MPRFEPLRALTSVAALAALGMALGYARDASLAAVFGASALTDAFFVATIIPAIVVAVSVSGALVPATLPVFGARLADRAQAWRLANALLTWSAALLTLAAILVFFAAHRLVTWLAPGLNVETRALAITLTQLGAPLIFLAGLSALLGAFANALGSFRLPALVTVWVNGAAFLAILLLGPHIGIVSALLGMLCGAALQLLMQGASLYQQGWRPKITFAWRHADVRETLRLFIPLAAFVALAQSVPIVERMLGSLFSSGDLSLLAYANKLFQIPGLVISSSLAIILYPRLIRAHAEPARAPEAWNEILTRGVRASFFLTLPLALWFWFNAAAVTRLLLERGAFSTRDAQTTAALAQLLMLAVVPAGILLVLTRGLHAQRKMNLALGLGALTTALYIAAAFFAARAFGLRGLPLAFVAAQIFGCALFARFAFHGRGWRAVWDRSFGATAAAGVSLAIVLWLTAPFVQNFYGLVLLGALGISLGGAALLYCGLAAWWGNPEARHYFSSGRARLKNFPHKLFFARAGD